MHGIHELGSAPALAAGPIARARMQELKEQLRVAARQLQAEAAAAAVRSAGKRGAGGSGTAAAGQGNGTELGIATAGGLVGSSAPAPGYVADPGRHPHPPVTGLQTLQTPGATAAIGPDTFANGGQQQQQQQQQRQEKEEASETAQLPVFLAAAAAPPSGSSPAPRRNGVRSEGERSVSRDLSHVIITLGDEEGGAYDGARDHSHHTAGSGSQRSGQLFTGTYQPKQNASYHTHMAHRQQQQEHADGFPRALHTASSTTAGAGTGHTNVPLGHASTGHHSSMGGGSLEGDDDDDITLGLEIESQLADTAHDDVHLLRAHHMNLLRRLPHIKLSKWVLADITFL